MGLLASLSCQRAFVGRRMTEELYCFQHATREKHLALQCMLQGYRGSLVEREHQPAIELSMIVTVLSKISRSKTITFIGAVVVLTMTTVKCASRSTKNAYHASLNASSYLSIRSECAEIQDRSSDGMEDATSSTAELNTDTFRQVARACGQEEFAKTRTLVLYDPVATCTCYVRTAIALLHWFPTSSACRRLSAGSGTANTR